uniref:Eukaryotic translation initiation factor 3 subunit G N-terminal domain-containing protein n=1 Tax=Tanacetum cinerariifolium TaxID=118510 RepID=A0A6L2JH18_TANCI|nr:hypothetical protein [Tanacetum cinerariifolium]
MEYLVKVNKKERILELKQRYFEDYCSDNQYVVSIKEDTAYLCLQSPKTMKTRSNTPYPEEGNVPYSSYMGIKYSRRYQTSHTIKTVADAKVAIQEMAEYSQKWHNGTSSTRSTKTLDGLAAIQAQLNNLGREIKKVNEKVYIAQVGCEQCKGPHYAKDCPLKEEGKTLEETYFTQFGACFQGGGYRETASGFYQKNNANPSYQERRREVGGRGVKEKQQSSANIADKDTVVVSSPAVDESMDATVNTEDVNVGQTPNSPTVNPKPKDVGNVSVWVKLHGVPITAFSEMV